MLDKYIKEIFSIYINPARNESSYKQKNAADSSIKKILNQVFIFKQLERENHG